MKPKTIILTLLVLMALAIIPCTAQTITMSNPMGISQRDMLVYWPNGSLQGLYNSTSVIVLDNTSDYIFAQRPLQSNPLEDPADWFDNQAVPFVTSNIIYLMAMVFLAAIWLGRK